MDTVYQTILTLLFLERGLRQSLGGGLLFFKPPLVAFAISILEKIEMGPHQNRVLHILLHTIHDTIAIRRRYKSTSAFSA